MLKVTPRILALLPLLACLIQPVPALAQVSNQREVAQYFARNLKQIGACQGDLQPEGRQNFPVQVYRVDQSSLVIVRCAMAAYQGSYEFYLYTKTGRNVQVQPLFLTEFEADAAGQVVKRESRTIAGLPTYSASRRTLTILSKFRGVGDCGSFSRYRLEGNRLTLQEYRLKSQCDGKYVEPAKYPRVYP